MEAAAAGQPRALVERTRTNAPFSRRRAAAGTTGQMTFLFARDRENSAFWDDVRADLNRGDVHVPNAIRDLALLHNFAVACAAEEADAALQWAQARPAWPADKPRGVQPLYRRG